MEWDTLVEQSANVLKPSLCKLYSYITNSELLANHHEVSPQIYAVIRLFTKLFSFK